jgi:hypothetical protein
MNLFVLRYVQILSFFPSICIYIYIFIYLFIYALKLEVCKSVHHHTFQINQPTRCKNFSSLLLDVYVQLNMFWAPPCPSSGATTTTIAASGLPLERGGSSAVGRGRACRPAGIMFVVFSQWFGFWLFLCLFLSSFLWVLNI